MKVNHDFQQPQKLMSCSSVDRKWFRPTLQHHPSCQWGSSWWSPSSAGAVLVIMVGPVQNRHFGICNQCFFFSNCLLILLSSLRHHALQLASRPEHGAAAKRRRDDQEEEEEEKKGPARGRRGRRREERGERRRVLGGRGHVYYRSELWWGERGGLQQVCVCVYATVWMCWLQIEYFRFPGMTDMGGKNLSISSFFLRRQLMGVCLCCSRALNGFEKSFSPCHLVDMCVREREGRWEGREQGY